MYNRTGIYYMSKYICAIGDSFVYGAELVTTYYPTEFRHLSKEQYNALEFGVCDLQTEHNKYNSLLDSMRFSSLVAKKLGYKHLNYSQGGASQESIKFQAYMLLEHLQENNINPADTIWLIGTTMQCRKMMMPDPHEYTFNLKTHWSNSSNWVWSRESNRTFFCDRLDQAFDFSDNFTKETVAATTTTQLEIPWIMNLIDTVNLLTTNNVANYMILNLFLQRDFLNFSDINAVSHTPALLSKLSKSILHKIYPTPQHNFAQYFKQNNIPYQLCDHDHPNKEGHKSIADFIIDKLS